MRRKPRLDINRLAVVALVFQAATMSAAASEYQCQSPPALLPHQQWDLSVPATSDVLYDRARAAIDHWSGSRELSAIAGAMLDELILREPENARGYVEYARLMMKAGAVQRLTLDPIAYEVAREAMRQAFVLAPESPSAWLVLGELEMHRRTDEIGFGNRDAQQYALAQAQKFGAGAHVIDFARARLAELLNDLSDASRYANQALEASDQATPAQLAQVHALLAHIARRLDQPRRAQREIKTAIGLEPDNPHHRVALSALWLEDHGDTKQAIAAAREALCIRHLRVAERALALALYNDWALDNLSAASPDATDPRWLEASALYDNFAEVMGYSAEHAPLAALVEVFVAVGADPNISDPHDDDTALENVIWRGEHESAQRLLAAGADADTTGPDFSVLAIAVLNDDRKMVELLLESGADINLQWQQGTALLTAVSAGNPEMVRYLLAAGADPHLGDDLGNTPLAAAIFLEDRERAKIMQALLEAGANPRQPMNDEMSVLEYAVRFADPEVQALLGRAIDAAR